MNKMSRNIIVTVIIIIVLVLVMVYSNSKNLLVRQLQGPTEGADSILTVDDRLSAVSKNNHIFTWQWNDLSIWPVVAKPDAQLVILVADDKIIYIPSVGYRGLVLSNLKELKQSANLDVPYGAECEKIKSSADGKFGAASILFKEGTQKNWLKLAIFDSNLKNMSFVFQRDTSAENFQISDFDVSNDGSLLAGAGKKEKAWIFITDTKNGNILWEKTFEEYNQFTLTRFSSDGKKLFVAEKARNILTFDAPTGQLLNKFVMDEYQTVAHLKQSISCMAVSPDGKVLAANTEPAGTVWLWDVASGRKIGRLPVGGGLIISGIAFSPDSRYLATSCMVSPEIKIWKVPKTTEILK
ncbi:MAG: WD40 repeat domain-containing protein [Sedimentisphaerales bacterium]